MLQTINKVTDYLKSISFIEVVYIVGSFAKGVTSHDIDMLLIGRDINKQKLQYSMIKDIGATMVLVNDDSISCQIDGFDFDFAFLSEDLLMRRANDITQMRLFGEHRNWCVGYWMPEGFLYDLKRAKIVFDKSGVVRECVNHLLSNYETTRQNLIEEIKKEIKLKSKTMPDLFYYNIILRRDVLAAFLRLTNLIEEWELTSFKHIDKKIRNTWYGQELKMLESLTDEQFPAACEALLQRYF